MPGLSKKLNYCILLPTGPQCAESESKAPMRVGCYYSSSSYWRREDKYTVENIQADLCTHIIYSFVLLDPETFLMKIGDDQLDVQLGNIKNFTDLKKTNPGVKLMVALGGWNDSRKPGLYSTLLASPSKRAAFVAHAVIFLEKWKFDGLDLEYEYPVNVGNVASDKAGFTALVRELRAAFDPKGWELTAAVGASPSVVNAGYEVPQLCNLLNAVHLMAYDLHGSWEKFVNNPAPLSSWFRLTVQNAYVFNILLFLSAKFDSQGEALG